MMTRKKASLTTSTKVHYYLQLYMLRDGGDHNIGVRSEDCS